MTQKSKTHYQTDYNNTQINSTTKYTPVYASLPTNWVAQIKNRIKDFNKINNLLHLTLEEQRGFVHTKFKFAVTPYILSLIDTEDENCPIRKQFIPSIEEIKILPEEMYHYNFQDTVNKNNVDQPISIINKFANSVRVLVTDQCASYCRFCSYKNFVGRYESCLTHGEFGLVIKYLKEHKEISHVIISGGDPLTLPDEKLEFFLSHLRKISHISTIEIETRIPVVLPQRVTQKLCSILKKYQPVYISIMFNHPKEITHYTESVCNLLSDNGIPLVSNTVLLKNINDKPQVLSELFIKLLKIRVKPFQLIQCDIVEGNSHFKVPLNVGLKLVKQLKFLISDFALPNFVLYSPNNEKVQIAPQSVIAKSKNGILVKDLMDKIFVYPEK